MDDSNSNSNSNSCFSTKLMIVGIVSLVHFASIATSFEVFSPFAPGGGKSGSIRPRLQNHADDTPPQSTSRRVRPVLLQSRISFVEQQCHPRPPDHNDDPSVSSLSSSRNGAAPFAVPRATQYRPNHSKLWLSSSSPESLSAPEPENADAVSGEGDTKDNNNPNVGYDDLYEFLTRRTGEPVGETERRRKRDRIMEFMGSGNSNGNDNDNTESGDSSSDSSTESGASDIIQPIRMEDGKVDEELVDLQRQEDQASRTKVRFESLFSGMPSLEEIISRDDPSEEDTDSNTVVKRKKTRMTDDDDFSWFEPERLRIEQEYEIIRQETRDRIRDERQLLQDEPSLTEIGSNEDGDIDDDIDDNIDDDEDRESIPDNAENIADAIVVQEMNRMINSVQVERAKERLQEYESQRSSSIQSRDYGGATDDVVDQIFKETAEEWERNEILKARADEYKQYEKASMEAAEQQSPLPDDSNDMDDWTLDRLEEMLEKSQNREDDNGSITDILEENIEDLRKQIERESKKSTIEPQTMKEWQMYRAIATRLTEEQQRQSRGGDSDSGSGNTDVVDESTSDDNRGSNEIKSNVDETQIAQQLTSWREYIEKEEGMRKQVGLSSVAKLPFDYLGTKTDQIEAEVEEAASENQGSDDENGTENMSRRELRRQVNIQAVQAMEDLIRKSDSRRTELLKKTARDRKGRIGIERLQRHRRIRDRGRSTGITKARRFDRGFQPGQK